MEEDIFNFSNALLDRTNSDTVLKITREVCRKWTLILRYS